MSGSGNATSGTSRRAQSDNDCECGAESTEVVVVDGGWPVEVCHACALALCDPLHFDKPPRLERPLSEKDQYFDFIVEMSAAR